MGVVTAPTSESKNNHKDTRSSLYVLLRKYRGLKTSGYGVTSKAVTYEPYRLTLTFREAPEDQRLKNPDITSANTNILLVISATPVRSIYKCTVTLFVRTFFKYIHATFQLQVNMCVAKLRSFILDIQHLVLLVILMDRRLAL